MRRKLRELILACSIAVMLPSCGHLQQLVAITRQPSGGFVFEGLGAQGQFTALGTYIHPPKTKDITNQVVRSLDIANFGNITQTDLITYTTVAEAATLSKRITATRAIRRLAPPSWLPHLSRV